MKHYFDRCHMPKLFNIGDKVYLHLYNGYNISANMGKNKKQGQRYTGPFEITECISHLAYHLNLPAHWCIHNVINIAFLEPAAKGDNPFNHTKPAPGAVYNERFPEDQDCYNIKQILAKWECWIGCVVCLFTEYLVHWHGFDKSHNKWLQAKDLTGAQDLVNEFDTST